MKIIAIFAFIFISVIATWLYNTNFLAIDSCLDNGGCWRYKTQQCEYKDQAICDSEHNK
jgi:phage-related protein